MAKGGGGGGGTTQTTQTVNSGPWQAQQPYLTDVFAKSQALYDGNSARRAFPTSTVAPLNENQNQGLLSILGTPNNANVPAASALNLRTLNGDFLNSNPWVDKTFGMASDAVKRQYMTGTAPQTAGAMAGAGRYGSGAYKNLMDGNQIQYGKTLDDLATGIYGGNYANERQIQQQAVGQAPGLAQAAYIDPLMRLMAGDRQQQQSQAEIGDVVNRFNFDQEQPTRALNTYLGQVTGNYGQSGTTTSQTPYYSNPMASMLGGGLGLASLFSGGANSAASGIGGLFGKGGGAAAGAGGLGSLMGSTMASLGPAAISDRRAKTHIRKVGVTNDGQNVYSFRYIGSARTEMGLMAQEVEKVHPEAVVEVNGLKHVNYALALKDAA